MEEDEKVVKVIANAFCKSVVYISMAVLLGMWLSNCNLNSEVIQQCEESCSGTNSQMESVTSGKCVCETSTNLENPWVLPR